MPRSAPRKALTYLGLSVFVVLLGGMPACSYDSYLVLTLKTDGPTLTGVMKVKVEVTAASGQPMVTRTFSVGGAGGASGSTVDAATGKTLSVSFTPERSGVVIVKVTISTTGDACAATGSTSTPIKKGGVASTTVTLSSIGCNNMDAGAADATTTFPGCDPAIAGSCPRPQTCYVDCGNKMGRCVPGGTKGAGETCTSNNDCAPGTQCFDFGCASTTRVCLKFCNNDAACNSLTSSAGASTCRDPVYCPAVTTYKTCGFACDPRGTATIGCPTGLNCFLFMDPTGGQDSPSCGCPAVTRVGGDGAACGSTEDCAPGFLCDQMAGGQFCRRLCKMSTPTDCSANQTCQALTNNTVFGVCI